MDSSQNIERPSAFGAFLRGSLSGAFSGALMTVIVGPLTAFVGGGALLAALGSTAAIMIPAAALFSGFMAVKHVMFDAPAHAREMNREAVVPVPVAGVSAPVIAPRMDSAPTPAQKKNWVEKSGRGNDGAENRIREILNNRSLTDKGRASAIYAAREEAAAEQAAR